MDDSVIKNMFDNNYIFGRGVLYPFLNNPFSIYNETFLETELRKLSREIGEPSAQRNSTVLRCNPNRSAVMLGQNSPLFTNIGYGIVNPPLSSLLYVGECDLGTGEGAKDNISKFYQRTETIEKNLEIYKSRLSSRDSSHNTSEIILNIYNDNTLSFIYFNNGPSTKVLSGEKTTTQKNALQAVYMKDIFNDSLNKDLPILKYSQSSPYPKLYDYDENTVSSLFIKIINSDEKFLKNLDNINYINHFSEQIKNSFSSDIVKKAIEELYECEMKKNPINFYEVYLDLNLSMALKKFDNQSKSDLLLEKTLDLLNSELSYQNSNLLTSFFLLSETKNEDFRFQQNLHRQPNFYFDTANANLSEISSYLSRFANEVDNSSLKIASKVALPIVSKKLATNKSIANNTAKQLLKKCVQHIKFL